MAARNYFSYLLNPLDLVRTKQVLQVNPTIAPVRIEPEDLKIFVYDYDAASLEVKELETVADCFHYAASPKVTWINVDGLRKVDVETICEHYGIH